jgi:ABC-type uncharacterized transport system permease subunit
MWCGLALNICTQYLHILFMHSYFHRDKSHGMHKITHTPLTQKRFFKAHFNMYIYNNAATIMKNILLSGSKCDIFRARREVKNC